MLERIRNHPGHRLRPARNYIADTDRYWMTISRFVKLERLQYFREPDHPSWNAFANGRWKDAMLILEKMRPQIAQEFIDDRANGLTSQRVRVVEYPLSPYLRWELHVLMVRSEYGENIRIVDAGMVDVFEPGGRILPELIFMDASVMYQIDYDESGTQIGGTKFTDAELVGGSLEDVLSLYEHGEDIVSFFDREIKPLDQRSVR